MKTCLSYNNHTCLSYNNQDLASCKMCTLFFAHREGLRVYNQQKAENMRSSKLSLHVSIAASKPEI